ncbi:MAG: TolC family protein [Cyclobacteriaceae bacterium]
MKNILALILIISGFNGFAQEELTLSDAIQISLANNFDILISKKNEEIATNNNNWGEAGRYPTIGLNVTGGTSNTNIDNPAQFLQGDIASRNWSPAATLNWTIFGGFNVRLSKERLAQLEDLSVGNTTILIENNIQAVILAFNSVLLESERLDVFQTTLDLSRDRFRYSQLKSELGSSVTFDVLQDKTAYLTDSSNYMTQRLNYQNSMRELNLLLNVEIDKPWHYIGELANTWPDYNLDELNARMTANNTNLENQYINQEILRKDAAIAQSFMYPSLNVGGGWSRNYQTQDLSGAEFRDGSNGPSGQKSTTTNYFANFTLAFTVFDGGRIRRQIENAKVQEQIGNLQIDQLKRTLSRDLMFGYETYTNRIALFEISQITLEAASFNLELGQERYDTGTINSFDFRDLQISQLQTALNYLQSRFDVDASHLELLRLTGGILDVAD